MCGALLVHYLHAVFGLAREGQYDFVDTWLMDGLLLSAGGLAMVGVGWAFVVVPTVAAAAAAPAFTFGSASYMVGDLVLLGLVAAGATGLAHCGTQRSRQAAAARSASRP